MLLTLIVTLLAAAAGLLLPKRWGAVGFAAAAIALFVVQVAYHSVTGFEGTTIEESLLLFNGSWVAYLGFNLQITYRAFALPLVALAIPYIYRLSKKI